MVKGRIVVGMGVTSGRSPTQEVSLEEVVLASTNRKRKQHQETPRRTDIAGSQPQLVPFSVLPPIRAVCGLTRVPLFQDPHVEQYESKEWTFIIENVSVGEKPGPGAWGDNRIVPPDVIIHPPGVQGTAEGAGHGRRGPGPPRRACACSGAPAAAAEAQVGEGGACRAEPDAVRGVAAGGPSHVSAFHAPNLALSAPRPCHVHTQPTLPGHASHILPDQAPPITIRPRPLNQAMPTEFCPAVSHPIMPGPAHSHLATPTCHA